MNAITSVKPAPKSDGQRDLQSRAVLRVALLGAGYIADWHAKAIAQCRRLELVAVCDRDLGRARALAARFGVPIVSQSIDELISATRLDAVHVLLPPELHFAAAGQLLDADLDVFIEKPMATTAEECAALARAASDRRRRVGVGHNFLFHRSFERLRRDLAAGLLGRIDHVAVTWNKDLPQARAGPFDTWLLCDPRNVMLEIGPHAVGQAIDLLGPLGDFDVRASDPVNLPSGVKFFRRWQVQGLSGTAAFNLNFSFIPGFAEHIVHVRGTLGTATADLERNIYVLRRHSRLEVDFDRFALSQSESFARGGQSVANIGRYLLSKARLTRDGNAYGSSIRSGIERFYSSPAEEFDSRLSPDFAAGVISVCGEIGLRAQLAGPTLPAKTPAPRAAPTQTPRTLVLGATGFIGQEVVRQLVACGQTVRMMARAPGKLSSSELRSESVEIIRGDISNISALDAALEGIDYVYHLARANVKTWPDYQSQEVAVTRIVAERSLAAGVKRFVYTGTIDSYYAGAGAAAITEDIPLDPRIERRNYYARAKALSEDLLCAMHREKGLPLVIVRPGIVIGRGGSPLHWGVGMWRHDATCLIWGKGENPLPLVLVEDVAAGLVAAMSAEGIEGASFNLIGDVRLTAKQYIGAVERSLRGKLNAKPTPIVRFYAADVAKWVVKLAVRHHDCRRPSYRDWASRTQRTPFDCSRAKTQLRWRPTNDMDDFVQRGITDPVNEFFGLGVG